MSGFYRQGEVISVAGDQAEIQLSLEGFCSGEHKCLFATFTRNLPSERNRIKAHNPVNACEGDKVIVEIISPGFYRALFYVFIFPLLALVGGVVVGYQLPIGRGISLCADLYAIACAAVFFLLALLVGRLADRREKPQYLIRKSIDQSLECEGCVLKNR